MSLFSVSAFTGLVFLQGIGPQPAEGRMFNGRLPLSRFNVIFATHAGTPGTGNTAPIDIAVAADISFCLICYSNACHRSFGFKAHEAPERSQT